MKVLECDVNNGEDRVVDYVIFVCRSPLLLLLLLLLYLLIYCGAVVVVE